MVQDGIKWYKMFHGGSRFQNSQRYLKHRKKYILHTYGLSAEGAKVLQKKKRTLDILPFSTVQSFSVLFSFLFVQIFPCGQVDSLFQIGHGATSPSLMVLFNARSNFNFLAPHVRSKSSSYPSRTILQHKTGSRVGQRRVKARSTHLEDVRSWLAHLHLRIRGATDHMVEQAEEIFVVLSLQIKSCSRT